MRPPARLLETAMVAEQKMLRIPANERQGVDVRRAEAGPGDLPRWSGRPTQHQSRRTDHGNGDRPHQPPDSGGAIRPCLRGRGASVLRASGYIEGW